MSKEIELIREHLKENSSETIHDDNLPQRLQDEMLWIGLQYTDGSQNIAKVESTKTCIYCNKPWSPDMEQLYLASGYCESCYEVESKTIIACSSCGKVVYIKEGHDA